MEKFIELLRKRIESLRLSYQLCEDRIESLRLSYQLCEDRIECDILRAQMEVLECVIEAAEAMDDE